MAYYTFRINNVQVRHEGLQVQLNIVIWFNILEPKKMTTRHNDRACYINFL